MPVTAKLSKLFYERLGEQIANELVDWFNSVDATYRADLRDLNELNFARFDARLEQRAAGPPTPPRRRARNDLHSARFDARREQRAAGLEGRIDRRTAELEAKIDQR